MNKISILEAFAADAINSPAMITGGGKCKAKSKSKKKSAKCGKSAKSAKSTKSRSGASICEPIVPKW